MFAPLADTDSRTSFDYQDSQPEYMRAESAGCHCCGLLLGVPGVYRTQKGMLFKLTELRQAKRRVLASRGRGGWGGGLECSSLWRIQTTPLSLTGQEYGRILIK